MKKILLTIIALACWPIFAQGPSTGNNNPSGCASAEGFIDDYLTIDAPEGIYYTGEPSIFSKTRSNGVLSVNITHGGEPLWAPMGVGFNDGDGDPTSINASVKPESSISVSNTSDTDVEIYFTFLADNEKATASKVGSTVSLFGGTIAGGASTTLSFDLENAVNRSWRLDDEACETIGGTLVSGTNNCIEDEDFDVSSITGIEWSINAAASAETSWVNGPLDGVTVEFSNFKVGKCGTDEEPVNEAPIITEITLSDPAPQVGNEVTIGITAEESSNSMTYSIQVDGENFSTKSANWTPSQAGIFEITATVTDNEGQSITQTRIINVRDQSNLPTGSLRGDNNESYFLDFLGDDIENCIGTGIDQVGGENSTSQLYYETLSGNLIINQQQETAELYKSNTYITLAENCSEPTQGLDLSKNDSIVIRFKASAPSRLNLIYADNDGDFRSTDKIGYTYQITEEQVDRFIEVRFGDMLWKTWSDSTVNSANVRNVTFRFDGGDNSTGVAGTFEIDYIKLGGEAGAGETSGCTDVYAENYNASASINDNSCTYTSNDIVTVLTNSQLSGNGPYDNSGQCIDNGYVFSFEDFSGLSKTGTVTNYINDQEKFNIYKPDNSDYTMALVKNANYPNGALHVSSQTSSNQWETLVMNAHTGDGTFQRPLNAKDYRIKIKSDATFDFYALLGYYDENYINNDGWIFAENNSSGFSTNVKKEYTGGSGWQTLSFTGPTHGTDGNIFDVNKATSVGLMFRNPGDSKSVTGDIYIDWIEIGEGKNQSTYPVNDCQTPTDNEPYTLTINDVVLLGGVITGYNSPDQVNIVIPNNFNGVEVIAIGESAFEDNYLESVVIPNSVVTIGKNAFEGNPDLSQVTLSDALVSIGEDAFQGNSLTSITLPNSLMDIGEKAFASNQLSEVTLPNSLTGIGFRAFSENNLTSFSLPVDDTYRGILGWQDAEGNPYDFGDLTSNLETSYSLDDIRVVPTPEICSAETGFKDDFSATNDAINYSSYSSVSAERSNGSLKITIPENIDSDDQYISIKRNLGSIDVRKNPNASVTLTNNNSYPVKISIAAYSSSDGYANASREGDNISTWGGLLDANSTEAFNIDLAKTISALHLDSLDNSFINEYGPNYKDSLGFSNIQEVCTGVDFGGSIVDDHCVLYEGFDFASLEDLEVSFTRYSSSNSGSSENNSSYELLLDDLELGHCAPLENQIPSIDEIGIDGLKQAGREISFFIDDRDSDGSIVSRQIIVNGQLISTEQTSFWTPDTSGTYPFFVIVTDNEGAVARFTDTVVVDEATTQKIPGCMDVYATNYNKNATVSNGSCAYNDDALIATLTSSQISGNGTYNDSGECIDDGYVFSFDNFSSDSTYSEIVNYTDNDFLGDPWNGGIIDMSSTIVKSAEYPSGALKITTVNNAREYNVYQVMFTNGVSIDQMSSTNLASLTKEVDIKSNPEIRIKIKSDENINVIAAAGGYTNDKAWVAMKDSPTPGGFASDKTDRNYIGNSGWQTLTFQIPDYNLDDELVDKSIINSLSFGFRDAQGALTVDADIYIDWIEIGDGINQISVPNEACKPADIYGCTDSTAVNYNPEATINDNTCEAPSFNAGEDVETCDQFIPIYASSNWAGNTQWASDGNGQFLPSESQSPSDTIYYQVSENDIENGTVLLTATKGDSTDTIEITIEQVLGVFAGNDIEQIGTTPFGLGATVIGNNITGTWSSSGSGSFLPDANAVDAIYSPSQEDADNSAVLLTFETDDNICPSKKDNLVAILQGCGITTNFNVEENKVVFSALNENPKVIAAYTWDFGDGTSGVGQTIEHLYTTSGAYTVTCSSVMSTGFCRSSKSFDVTISEIKEEEKSIVGTIEIGGQPLDYGTVAIFYVSENGNYELLDEVTIDPENDGEYAFDKLKESVYHILVTPSEASQYHETAIPTFIGGGSNIDEASFVETEEENNVVDISLETVTRSTNEVWDTGEDSYTATVVFDIDFDKKSGRAPRELFDDPKPVQAAVVLLSDLDGRLLSFTSTDKFGAFKFQDLQEGLYDLDISYIGSTSKIKQQIVIDGDEQTVVDDFYVLKRSDNSGDLKDDPSTSIGGTGATTSYDDVYLFPNPSATGVFTISDQYNKVINATVYNQLGSEVLTVKNSKTIDLKALPSGSYLVKTQLVNDRSAVFLIQKNR